MGGGKETPRQKMIGMMYLVLTALLAMNVSKQILKGYIAVNDSMEASKKNLKENNTRLLDAFSQSLGGNPAAKPYYDESLLAKKNIDETFKYIDELKAEIIKETEGYEIGSDTARLKYMEKMSDFDKPTHVLIGSEAATPREGAWSARELRAKLGELSDKLGSQLEKMQKDPKTKLFPADYEAIKKKFQSIKPVDTGEMDNGVKLDWEAANFYHLPEAAVITNLNKMQSDLRNVEAEFLNVYSAASGKLAIKFDHIVARVVAPSSYILAGTPYEADIFLAASSSKLGQGDMEIILGVDSAGAAAGSKGTGLVTLVNGEGKMSVGTGGQGVQEYKGVIKYKNPDGTFKYYPFNGEYMVAAPSVAVSADQMKVFYAGVVNPVSIGAAGVAPTELVVNATGGGVKMVAKGGGKFDFTFSGTGDCMITVSAKTKDGVKPQGPPVKFKVKPLPKPELKVAQKFSPPDLKKGDLGQVGSLGAGANGFEFQANFIVQSWEVSGKSKGKFASQTGTSPNLDATARQILSSADVGSRVYIDAKIKGPDGKFNNVSCSIKVTR